MKLTPKAIAEDASFHAFINCYLREINEGKWYCRDDWCSRVDFPFLLSGNELVELFLPSARLRVLMDVAYHSKVGRHHFHCIYLNNDSNNSNSASWQQADLLYLLIALVRDIYQCQSKGENNSDNVFENAKFNEMELLARMIDSCQLMSQYLEARAGDSALHRLNFIDTEQSSLFGHWLHPTPKSRHGIAFWQQKHYMPELRAQFKLHYFSVDKHLVFENSVLSKTTSEILFDELVKHETVELTEGHVLIPIHPLQAHWLLLQDWVRASLADGSIIYLGEKGADYTPTSSVRTLFNANSEWMLKFSIPVKITNSLRNNMRKELREGMVIERYLYQSGFFARCPQFKMIDEPGYISVNMPGFEHQESGFEVILRRNVFTKTRGEGICSILALAQSSYTIGSSTSDDSLLKQLVQRLATTEGRSLEEVALDWFAAYWHCAVKSLILLYDSYGIALEAHQQNSLLDVSQGYPSCYYYRDNQGLYLSRQYSETLCEIDTMLDFSEMYYNDEEIFSAMSYYVFINQLFAIIYRLGFDGLVEEDILIARCRNYLHQLKKQMQGVGKKFIDYILESRELCSKTNLLARIHNIDELHDEIEHSIYSAVANPLYTHTLVDNETGPRKIPKH